MQVICICCLQFLFPLLKTKYLYLCTIINSLNTPLSVNTWQHKPNLQYHLFPRTTCVSVQCPDDRSSTLCKHRAVVLDPRAADWTTQPAWQIKPTQRSNPQLHPSDKSQFPLCLRLCTHRHVWPSPQWVVPKTKGLDYSNDINWTQYSTLVAFADVLLRMDRFASHELHQ